MAAGGGLIGARPGVTNATASPTAKAKAAPNTAAALDDQPIGRGATIVRVVAPAHSPEWALRLAEIGYMPGERVMVAARGWPGGEPLAVRVGNSTFALRRAEAACIQVTPDEAPR